MLKRLDSDRASSRFVVTICPVRVVAVGKGMGVSTISPYIASRLTLRGFRARPSFAYLSDMSLSSFQKVAICFAISSEGIS